MEVIGWIGSIMFALCGLPQAIQCYKQKHSNGISHGMLWMWFFGEVLMFIYIFPKPDVLPLLFNYVVNFACLIVIMWYKYAGLRLRLQ